MACAPTSWNGVLNLRLKLRVRPDRFVIGVGGNPDDGLAEIPSVIERFFQRLFPSQFQFPAREFDVVILEEFAHILRLQFFADFPALFFETEHKPITKLLPIDFNQKILFACGDLAGDAEIGNRLNGVGLQHPVRLNGVNRSVTLCPVWLNGVRISRNERVHTSRTPPLSCSRRSVCDPASAVWAGAGPRPSRRCLWD